MKVNSVEGDFCLILHLSLLASTGTLSPCPSQGWVDSTTFMWIKWQMSFDPPICFCLDLRKVLPAGIQTVPFAGDPKFQETRRCFRTVVPDTKVRVWGHRKSGCRVAVVMLEKPQPRPHWQNFPDYIRYVITGIPLVTT